MAKQPRGQFSKGCLIVFAMLTAVVLNRLCFRGSRDAVLDGSNAPFVSTPLPSSDTPRPRFIENFTAVSTSLYQIRETDRRVTQIARQPPQPVFNESNSLVHSVTQAGVVSAWEAERVRSARNTYFRKKAMTGPMACLPDGEPMEGLMSLDEYLEGIGEKTLPQTKEAQRRVFLHQHPQNCKNSSFLVWKMWNTGLGADLHTLAQALGFAISSNRVLLVDDSALWWYAMDRSPSSIECFFERISNCTLADAGEVEILTPTYSYDTHLKKVIPKHRPKVKQNTIRSVGNPLRLAGDLGNKWSSVPFPDMAHYGYQWWMSQSSRYILRKPRSWLAKRYDLWVDRVFPEGVPPRMIGIHVRHGDKYKEMRLLPLSSYMQHAAALRKKEPNLTAVFLSTEDDAVLNDAKEYEKQGWTFFWTKHARHNRGSPMDYALHVGPSMLAEISFTNLLIQARLCTHWVGTDQSNWNRLINELRLTSGSYGADYLQLNKKKCAGGGTSRQQNTTLPEDVPGWEKGC